MKSITTVTGRIEQYIVINSSSFGDLYFSGFIPRCYIVCLSASPRLQIASSWPENSSVFPPRPMLVLVQCLWSKVNLEQQPLLPQLLVTTLQVLPFLPQSELQQLPQPSPLPLQIRTPLSSPQRGPPTLKKRCSTPHLVLLGKERSESSPSFRSPHPNTRANFWPSSASCKILGIR